MLHRILRKDSDGEIRQLRAFSDAPFFEGLYASILQSAVEHLGEYRLWIESEVEEPTYFDFRRNFR